ncbi:hypothetical protein B0A48_09556 [Cryoendolithus antarcticus]|uniref:MIF4G domain-containing protein n=1 Tax=Cryoendolithus antarcticus TaxID=1507870 RepID=A0A1V8SZY2_9PEZI|nr:hypothetical protein B0A48_09556 [Cryoendolithus antarcticus]
MADVDRRRDDRNGGAGFRGGRNDRRKRGREDDEYEHGNFRNQRARQEVPPGTRIRRVLVEAAEDVQGREPVDVKGALSNVGKLAAENWGDEYVREVFVAVALKVVAEQPLKIPFMAAAVLYANEYKSEAAAEVVAAATSQLQEALQDGAWRTVKLLLRFIACLSPLFEEDGIVPVLNELFDRAVDLQTASSEDAIGIELVKIILLTIPYLIAANDSNAIKEQVAELLEKTEIVATAPHSLDVLVNPYPAIGGDDESRPMAFGGVISLIQRQLQEETNKGWPLSCIPRAFDPVKREAEANGDTNGNEEHASSQKHAFPVVEVPSPVYANSGEVFPEAFFSLYADQDVESVPPTTHIACSLIRDAVVDTVNILDFNRNATSKYLNELDNFWTPGTFTRRETGFDRLKEYTGGVSTWKPEDVGIDALFSQIFKLPTPQHRLICYHSVITEVCKLAPQAIAPSLGRAIRFIYRSIDQLDLELQYRFMDWFAHHLSNFEFRWKWQEWIADIPLPEIHPRRAFINGALDKEIRLSFAKRIRETLPDPFQALVPASKEKDVPDFKYADDKMPYASEARALLKLLKEKASEEQIQAILDDVRDQATSHGVPDPLVPSTDVYMTCILNVGSKSMSHVISNIDRLKDKLSALATQSEAARRQIISSVVDFWSLHPGNAANIVDKLLNYTIITPMSVIEWALHERMDRGRALASAQMYELVSHTVAKVSARVRQVLQQRANTSLPFDQRQVIDAVLPRERQTLRDLYATIEDAVASVANGSQDEMMERYEGEEEERAIIMQWGERWARVWRRKAAVEEAVVGEAAVGELIEPEPVPEPEQEPVADMNDALDAFEAEAGAGGAMDIIDEVS